MKKNPFAPEFESLPESLPVFPLSGVLLLPGGTLPLNIFEPRYLAMVDAALTSGHRLIGMIQPLPAQDFSEKPTLSTTGCAGKIIDFNETGDGRYIVSLSGICRFKVASELDTTTPYRQIKADWSGFERDLITTGCLGLNRERLTDLLRDYFDKEGMDCEWNQIESTTDGKLITCLSMICPFEPQEKQALLEAQGCKERAELFMTMLELAIKAGETFHHKTQH